MRVCNRHERFVRGTPEQVAALVGDFEQIWPVQFGPAPRLRRTGLYEAGVMLWLEADRPGAVRAFRVISPEELRFEHWFEIEQVADGVLVRHTILGEAVGKYEAIWHEQSEPVHDLEIEALFDNIQTAVARG
jgi:hypothetical protein